MQVYIQCIAVMTMYSEHSTPQFCVVLSTTMQMPRALVPFCAIFRRPLTAWPSELQHTMKGLTGQQHPCIECKDSNSSPVLSLLVENRRPNWGIALYLLLVGVRCLPKVCAQNMFDTFVWIFSIGKLSLARLLFEGSRWSVLSLCRLPSAKTGMKSVGLDN